MRAPTDLPRRRLRPPRRRLGLVVAASVLFLLIVSLRGIAGFYTDFLWFDELGLARVWRGVLGAKIALGVIFTGLFFAVLWLNLVIADRLAPKFPPAGPEEELVERYREVVGTRTGLVRVATAAVFALIAGPSTSSQWNSWILFTHRVDFGRNDPQFHTDIGFFVFQLPFLKFVVDWAFASLVIVLIVTAVAHYLNGGIRVQVPAAQRVSAQVKGHLSVLLGVLALLKAAGYWLQRYELSFSTRGFVDGAGFTDVKAKLPALQLLVIISVAAFVLFLVNIRLRGWVLPVIAVGLWALTSVVVGGAVPAFVQKFQVQPNQSTKERPYIQRNIEATRRAMNLSAVQVKPFNYDETLTTDALENNNPTIRNVRLWDPRFLGDTYRAQQEIRSFYRFNDVDVDRYQLDGEETQVVLSARELDPSNAPSSWENQHLNFTHGYGAVLSPANAVTDNGLPKYLLSDLPPKGTPALDKQPAVYFGEDLGGYAIVRTRREEIDYQQRDGTTKRTTYQGTGGVQISSFVRRVAFALRFGDVNPLASNFITRKSRAIYIRDIRERARKAAPFLRYDADPYPVILEGRMLWVQDAYTVTSKYPYGQRVDTTRLSDKSGLRTSFNYARNSVKVVTDAFNGQMTFYVVDEKDPIIRAYRRAFPQLFTSGKGVSPDLRAHFRYPEDLFRAQTNMYGVYHITKANEFFDRGDAWRIARDPGSGAVASGAGATQTATDTLMDPYYLLTKLPRAPREEFLILQPFTTPKNLLSAFMVAKSDPQEYGKLEAYEMPRNLSISGPTQIDAKIKQETEISRELTLLNQSGSSVRQGNLLVIPIEQSLLYIRPLYVQAEGGTRVPELKRVIVVFGDRAVMRPRLAEALQVFFPDFVPETQEEGTGPPNEQPPRGTRPQTPQNVSPQVAALLADAATAFNRADQDLRRGDLAAFATDFGKARELTRRAQALANPSSSSTTTTSTTTPSA